MGRFTLWAHCIGCLNCEHADLEVHEILCFHVFDADEGGLFVKPSCCGVYAMLL